MLEASSIFLLPKTSESEPAGRLTNMPGMVEAAATKPVQESGVPRLDAKSFKTGFFDMVELRIANSPIAQSARKITWLRPAFFEGGSTEDNY